MDAITTEILEGMVTALPLLLETLLISGFIIASRVNKFPQVFSFLGVYFLSFLSLGLLHIGSLGDPLRTPFINSALFLAFFMLTDPPTSPGTAKHQLIFGVLTAIISVGGYVTVGGLAYLLIGVLCANTWNPYQSKTSLSRSMQKAKQHQQKKNNPQLNAH